MGLTMFPPQVSRNTFRVLVGCALAAALLPNAHLVSGQARGEPAAPPHRAVLIRFEGVITPLLEQFFYRKLKAAEDDGADVVIVEIDSPGGTVTASFNVAQRLRDLDWAQTVAFIPREALSGAAFVALGCDQIIMAPHAVLGDAGPIFQGEDALFHHAPEKIRTDVASKVRDLAAAKRRPPALAEAMVDMNLAVYQVTNQQTGETTFMSDREIETSGNPEAWEKGPQVQETGPGRFLEVNGPRAVELKLADGQARNREELKRLLKLDDALRVVESSFVDTTVYILNDPFVTGLLFVIGLVALYIEFHIPGTTIGGLIAGLCFALFFWSRFLGGTAELLQVILFLAGLVFLAMEVFVIPGFGVAGIAGILLMFVSVVMACQGFAIPTTGRELQTFSTTLLVVACSGAAFLAVAAWLRRYFDTLPMLNRLVLQPALPAAYPGTATATLEAAALGLSRPVTLREVAVGDRGVALSPLRPAGKARFGEAYLDVLTDGSFVDGGRPVRIIEICGNRIVVEEVEEA
jgi:membrane-bound serine protease (ClpP class)